MKINLLFLTLFIYVLSFGQYEDESNKLQLSIRGKVYAGPTGPENLYGQMMTTGVELKFLNYHSIGADYVYFRNAYEHESLSPSGYYNNNGEYDITFRRYLNFDYRIYFKRNYYQIFPYFNLFTKIGKEQRLFYDGTELEENILFNYDSHFNEYGFAIGSRFAFGERGIVGLDINVGAVNSNHYIYSFQPLNQSTTVIYNFEDSFWKPHMRLNLYFNLFKIK